MNTENSKNETLYSRIFYYSVEAILVSDGNGKIIQANPSCLALFEYSLEELLGTQIEKLIPNGLQKKHITHRENYVKKPESRKMHSGLTLTGIKKNGEKLSLEIGLSYVKNEEEILIICFLIDVSDRKKWQNQINHQHKILQQYLDVTTSIFLILDREENILMINKVGSKVLGISEKAAVGKNWFNEFVPEDEKESVRDFFKKMISGKIGDSSVYENHIINSEGKKRLIEWHNTLIRNEKGQKEATLSNGVDITEKREIEAARTEALITGQENERRRLAQELHDGLGQSISAIGLNINALEPELENFNLRFKRIYSGIKDKLDNAIQEIRTISKNLTPLILEDFGLERALEYLGETIENSTNVKFDLSIHGDLGNIDKKILLAIYRITQELIRNSLQHSNAKTINVYVTRNEKTILTLVEDDGIGFDPETQTGGLGLSNLKSRVELLKGQITIDSYNKGGTSVSINIPL